MEVYLKPTEYQEKQVLFGAYSPGGTSLYDNEDYLEAISAVGITSSGGIGRFNSQQIGKVLSGKTVAVGPYISKFSEGFEGSAQVDDLEILLQLVYLFFTNPRFDKSKLALWKQHKIANLQNKYTSPYTVYKDTLSKVMNSHAERYAPIEISDIKSFNFKRMKQIYLDRFADASDFAFFFVGDFDIDKIQSTIVKYLGNLPVIKRKESWRDLGIHPPKGPLKKVVAENTVPKSIVNLIITGKTNYSIIGNTQLGVLGQILQQKLRKTLREKVGGVYSVGVSAEMSSIPDERYSVQIGFACAPKNVDKLIGLVYKVIDKIKKGYP